ncbi:MAG: glycosyltransferase family 4 protein, partial [Veillonella sp.]|nr:glycosyltransferase family 4 protein [Veillonella sp.]
DVYIFANFSDNSILERFTNLGFKCVDSKIKEQNINPIIFLSDIIRSFRTLNKINPDVLHCVTIKPGVISCLWSRIRNKKMVYSFVGLGRVFESNKIIYQIAKYLIANMYKRFFLNIDCCILFEHRKDQHKIIELLGIPENKTEVIDGAGINIDYFCYTSPPDNPKVKVFFASRMLWSKGLRTLIDASRILKLQGIEFEIVVAGIIVDNDRDAISITQIEEWHNSGDINWLGRRSDIKELIETVDIVALPSVYSEGIPRILLEAGAIGRPVISFDTGGCGSLILDGYNGFLVPKGNINVFSQKLGRLIMSPQERDRMGRNARKRVEEKYSSTVVIQKTVEIYRKLKM